MQFRGRKKSPACFFLEVDGVTGYYGNNKNIIEREIVLETQVGNRKKWFDFFGGSFRCLKIFLVITHFQK